MQLHEAGELIEVNGPGEANRKLQEGWVLLAVVASERTAGGSSPCYYVLGKPKAPPPGKT